MPRTKITVFVILAMLFAISWTIAAGSAGAAEISRLPTATEVVLGKVCFRSTPKGNYAAWYGDRDLPDVVACAFKTCNLVASKRALAAFLSGPITRERFNAAMAPYKKDPYKDQELREVWIEDFIKNCEHIK